MRWLVGRCYYDGCYVDVTMMVGMYMYVWCLVCNCTCKSKYEMVGI